MSLSERQHVADMTQCYDALGPLARAAVRMSPMEITVGEMMIAWRRENIELITRDESYRLTDPEIDASIAAFVRAAIKRKFGKPPEMFVIQPRIGSVRHQRR